MNKEEIEAFAKKMASEVLAKKIRADFQAVVGDGKVEVHEAKIMDEGLCINMSIFLPNSKKEPDDGK